MFRPTLAVLTKVPKKPVQGMVTRGLFDGKHIYFGNQRSHSEIKTRRNWRPNVQTKHYKSEILGRILKVKVTTSAIRSIDKAGGFDNYMVETRDERLGYEGSFGVNLKREMIKKLNIMTNGRGLDTFVLLPFKDQIIAEKKAEKQLAQETAKQEAKETRIKEEFDKAFEEAQATETA